MWINGDAMANIVNKNQHMGNYFFMNTCATERFHTGAPVSVSLPKGCG